LNVVLLHIPKTAGTAIEKTIASWIGPDQVEGHIEVLDTEARRMVLGKRFVSGHLFFNEVQELRSRFPSKLAISLREPYARLASALQMVDRYSRHGNEIQYASLPGPAQAAAAELALVNLNEPAELEYYMERISGWARVAFDNCQTRFMLNNPNCSSKGVSRKLSEEDLLSACKNISSADYICLAEKLPECITRLARELNHEPLGSIMRTNTADSGYWRRARRIDFHQPRIRAVMEPFVHYDLKLYEHAAELFANR
jgi:hypothetical protein